MIRDYKLRNSLLRQGLSDEATELCVFIDKVTKQGKKGPEVFEKLSLVQRVEIGILSVVPSLRPHLDNFRRLYQDSEYMSQKMDLYQRAVLNQE